MICVHRPCAEMKKAPQSDGEPDVYFAVHRPQRQRRPQSRSKIVAIPCPPPMHIVTSA